MKNKHMRVMLCLLMCCALLFTCVARPASATSTAVVVGLAAIPVAVAVACTFQALGYMSASNSISFTNTVNQASSWFSENSDWVVNGAVTLLGLTSDVGTVSYLPSSFIQDVWQWLFDSGSCLLNVSNQISVSNSIFGNGILKTNYPVWVAGYQDDGRVYMIMVSEQSNTYSFTGDSSTSGDINKSYNGLYYYTNWGPVSSQSPSYPWLGSFDFISTTYAAQYIIDNFYPGVGVTTVSDDISLGQIQSPYQSVGTEEETIEIEIAPIYIDWTKYGVPDPNDPGGDDPDNDGKFPMWLPTGIPSPGYDDSVITQNQQQAQSGVVSGDITFEPYEPDDPGSGGGAGSGTDLSSVIQAIINVPTAIVSGIGDFISDYFGFNGNPEDYILQLRDFFPFCIPFDLYDFITVLSAEPEAPVFHWEIPVPQLGQTFELEVDLSAWDDIAVLFRNLELLAFIFGLAVMTREKFLRS